MIKIYNVKIPYHLMYLYVIRAQGTYILTKYLFRNWCKCVLSDIISRTKCIKIINKFFLKICVLRLCLVSCFLIINQ